MATFAACAAEKGRVDLGERFITAAFDELRARGEQWNEAPIHNAAAVVAHAAGDDERADEQLQLAVDVATRQGAHAIARRAERLAAEWGDHTSS